MGQGKGANQPTEGLCVPLTYSHVTRGFGAPHLGFPPPGLGAKSPKVEIPSALAVAPPRGNPRAPPPPLPLYILEVLGCHTHENISFLGQPYPSPSSSLAVLGEALLACHAPPPSPRRRVAAGRSPPQPLLLSLLDQGTGDVTGLYVC